MAENAGMETELKLVLERRSLELSLTADPGFWNELALPREVQELLTLHPPQRFESQHDIYFDHPQIGIAERDQVLRQRQSIVFQKKKSRWELHSQQDLLTWKGAATRAGGLKSREEIEGSASSELMEILQRLGFTPALEIRKHRWLSKVESVTVSLDAVHRLGFFLELEVVTGKNEAQRAEAAIEHFRRKYHLNLFPEEPLSYARLLQQL